MGCTAYNEELVSAITLIQIRLLIFFQNSIALTKATKKNIKPSINEPVTETDGPVEEVDEFDFQDEEFRKLIEEYAQNYESDDDVDSVSASDSGKKQFSVLFQKKKLKAYFDR